MSLQFSIDSEELGLTHKLTNIFMIKGKANLIISSPKYI